MYQCVLFCLCAFETFQVYYQHRWSLINLDLFNSLFMSFTSVTVPCILLTQLFLTHELAEAIVYWDSVSLGTHHLFLFKRESLTILTELSQILKHCPTPIGIKLDLQFKFHVLRSLLKGGWPRGPFALFLAAPTPVLFRVLIIEVGLSGYSVPIQVIKKGGFIIKGQRTSLTLLPLTIYTPDNIITWLLSRDYFYCVG